MRGGPELGAVEKLNSPSETWVWGSCRPSLPAKDASSPVMWGGGNVRMRVKRIDASTRPGTQKCLINRNHHY